MESSWTGDSPLFPSAFLWHLDTPASRTDLLDPFLTVLDEGMHVFTICGSRGLLAPWIHHYSLCLVLWNLDNSANNSLVPALLPPSLSLSAIGLKQMKADVSGCWLCLSDTFSLIPLSLCGPRWGERWLHIRRSSTQQQKAAESVHVRILISSGSTTTWTKRFLRWQRPNFRSNLSITKKIRNVARMWVITTALIWWFVGQNQTA